MKINKRSVKKNFFKEEMLVKEVSLGANVKNPAVWVGGLLAGWHAGKPGLECRYNGVGTCHLPLHTALLNIKLYRAKR